MDEAIRQIHNTAMDLSEIARIKRSREGEVMYQHYLNAAYELELYAASKIKENNDKNDQLWRATLLRSAGWLAFKCGYYYQAKRLVEVGLSIPTDGHTLSKLQVLQAKIEDVITQKKITPTITSFTIYGLLSGVDIDTNQINIKNEKTNNKLTLSVQKEEIPQIVTLFLGTKVEIEAIKKENNTTVVKNIRWAA